jgi:hypothetical protein
MGSGLPPRGIGASPMKVRPSTPPPPNPPKATPQPPRPPPAIGGLPPLLRPPGVSLLCRQADPCHAARRSPAPRAPGHPARAGPPRPSWHAARQSPRPRGIGASPMKVRPSPRRTSTHPRRPHNHPGPRREAAPPTPATPPNPCHAPSGVPLLCRQAETCHAARRSPTPRAPEHPARADPHQPSWHAARRSPRPRGIGASPMKVRPSPRRTSTHPRRPHNLPGPRRR